jgi:hypothetical protein
MAVFPPEINGHRYSYASLAIEINGTTYGGIRKINYSAGLTPGHIYGSDPHKAGRTPGKAEHECDFEVLRREWNEIVRSLGQSYGRVPFNIQVQYAETGDEGVTNDVIIDCRITRVTFSNDEGNEASVAQVTCDPMDIRLGRGELSIDLYDPNRAAVETQ